MSGRWPDDRIYCIKAEVLALIDILIGIDDGLVVGFASSSLRETLKDELDAIHRSIGVSR